MFINVIRADNGRSLPIVLNASQIVTITPDANIGGSLICLEDRIERTVRETPEEVKQLSEAAIRLTLGQHFDVFSPLGENLSAIGERVDGLADRVEGLGTSLDAIATHLAALAASQ